MEGVLCGAGESELCLWQTSLEWNADLLLYMTSRNAEQTNIYWAERLSHLTAVCVCVDGVGGGPLLSFPLTQMWDVAVSRVAPVAGRRWWRFTARESLCTAVNHVGLRTRSIKKPSRRPQEKLRSPPSRSTFQWNSLLALVKWSGSVAKWKKGEVQVVK